MKGVKYFLASLIALVVLSIGFYSFSSVRYSPISENVVSFGNVFELHDLSASISNGVVQSQYYVHELSGKDRELNVSYTIYNSDGQGHSSDEVIFVKAGSNGAFNFKLNSEGIVFGSISVSAADAEGKSLISTPLGSATITGNVIAEDVGRVGRGAVLFFFILLTLFLFARWMSARNGFKDYRNRLHQSGKISLDLK